MYHVSTLPLADNRDRFFIAVANLLSLKDTRLDMQSKVLRAGIAAEENIRMQMIYHLDAINLTYGVLLNN